MAKALQMVHEVGAREELLARIKVAIPQMMGARVLVATYMRPEKTRSGLYLPDKARGEDAYQGKVGLVIGMGPLAFHTEDGQPWTGRNPKQGDWVLFNIGDTRRLMLDEVECRWLDDVHVAGIVENPDEVY